MSTTSTKTSLTLKGSASIITDYLKYAFHTILYQRGIYPPDSFHSVRQYGMCLWMSKNETTANFLLDVLSQVYEWISRNDMDRISLVFRDRYTREVEEFWQFTTQQEPKTESFWTAAPAGFRKIQEDIACVMRQITCSNSFLPRIENVDIGVSVHFVRPMSADELPPNWRPAEAPTIRNGATVPLRSFTTGFHFMQTSVVYADKSGNF